MDEDTATGIRIARQCTHMSIAAFASVLASEFADRTADSEETRTAFIQATLCALYGYTRAGGILDAHQETKEAE